MTGQDLARLALSGTGLPVPEGWQPVSVRRERHDDLAVTVVRFQSEGPHRPGGEHVTVVADDQGTLLGYTRMVIAEPAEPLDPALARTWALRWLRGFAADYADGLTVSWVDRHDETVTDAGGTEHVISGMKTKTHHDSGRYAWVVLDGGGEVLTYERDVRWDSAAGRRATEMWLHDKWIAAREGIGPQPGPPYAIAC